VGACQSEKQELRTGPVALRQRLDHQHCAPVVCKSREKRPPPFERVAALVTSAITGLPIATTAVVPENHIRAYQRRKVRSRVQLTNGDRLFFVQLYRWFPSVLNTIAIIRPETLVRWHRAGFRRYWCWKSRSLRGRPQIDADLRALIRRMSVDNPLWGAPRIHGELLKLGFEVAQSSVAKYMVKRSEPPSPGWRAFPA
jgi:hypothetical protein